MIEYGILAAQYGTPLYVYSLDQFTSRVSSLQRALGTHCNVLYSVKANPNPSLVRLAIDLGCGLDVSSLVELELGNSMDARSPIFYSGPGKVKEELEAIAVTRNGYLCAESAAEVERFSNVARRLGTKLDCLVRLNVSRRFRASLQMGSSSQFGTSGEEDAIKAIFSRADSYLEHVGFHIYESSNLASEAVLIDRFAELDNVIGNAVERYEIVPRLLDLGGGFPAEYGVENSSSSLSVETTYGLQAVVNRLHDTYQHARLFVEAGRYVSGPCGSLLLSVVDKKRVGADTWVVLDGGINIFGGVGGSRRLLTQFEVRPVRPSTGIEEVSISGSLCTPADVLVRKVKLPTVEVGDLMLISNAGAYGLTASPLAFIGRPMPAEVSVADGQVTDVSTLKLTRENTHGDRVG